MLKVATLAVAMMASTAAFAVELHGPAAMVDPNTGRSPEWQATDPVYGMEYCGQNPQPNYCPTVIDYETAQRLIFDPQSIAEWDQTKARQWYWAQYRAKHPLTTADGEAAPIGLVGEPFPPGNEQVAQGGIGSDYVAQAKADRAVEQAINKAVGTPEIVQAFDGNAPANCPQPTAERDAFSCNPNQQQANTAAIKEDALAAKDAAVLSAHAEAKPKRTRTHKH